MQWSVMIVVGYFTTVPYSFITTFAQKMTIHKALTRPHPLREIAEPGQPGSCPVHTPLRPIAEPGRPGSCPVHTPLRPIAEPGELSAI